MKIKFFQIYIQSLLIISIFSQLSILSPYSLVEQFFNKQIEMAYGKVGLLSDFYVRGQLFMDTVTENHDACTPLEGLNLRKKNDTIYDENFKVLIAYRGTCSFAQKARNAQNAGASMLIVINVGNTPINNVIFTDDSNDIYIPVALINTDDGKILDNFMKLNPGKKVLAEINFSPKNVRKVVDFKFFFSSSEPRAYELIEKMRKYLDKFGTQISFTPYYVVHKNPYYIEEKPKSNINCLSRGVYCYFPKETTIVQEGQKILLEDIRQKCLFNLNQGKSNSLYYDYMNTFYKECIKNSKNSLTKLCSETTLEKLGYSRNYLDECISKSFDTSINELSSPSLIDKENKILKIEYDELLKYKLKAFPAVVINDKVVQGIIREQTIVAHLCINVKYKPTFCPYITGFTDIHRRKGLQRNKLVYFLIILLIFINISLFFMCRAYINEKINDRINSENIDVDSRINNVINNYFALTSNSDYKAFEPKNQVIEMKEGSVSTI